VARDGKLLRELCERVAKEPDPVKLRVLIAQLSRVFEVEEEHCKDCPVAESSVKTN